jgi:uncharacterized protein (DUF1778 family)
MVDTVSQVTIDLEEMPTAGPVQTIVRTRQEDKLDIKKAAAKVGMLESDFMRTVLVNAARKVNAE